MVSRTADTLEKTLIIGSGVPENSVAEAVREPRYGMQAPGQTRRRSGVDQIFLNEAGVEVALDEVEVLKDLTVKRNRRTDSVDGELVESPPHGQDRLFTGITVNDQLAEQ